MILSDLREKDFVTYYMETFGYCDMWPGKLILLTGKQDNAFRVRMLGDDKKEVDVYADMTGVEWTPLYLDDGYYNALKTVVAFTKIRRYQRAVSTSDHLICITAGNNIPSRLRLLEIMSEEKYCSSIGVAVKALQSPSIKARAVSKEYAIMRPTDKTESHPIMLYGNLIGNIRPDGEISLFDFATLLKEELESL
jgi:hypothetical protein